MGCPMGSQAVARLTEAAGRDWAFGAEARKRALWMARAEALRGLLG